ncbi:thioredoxin family protein [Paenibacillus koleovorans]|uniref:thioredoxin family protein n=1 Tax=Paenibacillus koleovorans TaxID=121608 RepID=UPI000FD92F7B|nr:thioredoxin family protein [Paenibacillus koleovorans]
MAIEWITEQHYHQEVGAAKVTLIDFTSAWCPPCKLLLPLLEELQRELGEEPVRIMKVNADEAPSVVTELGIMGLPTVMLYRDGQPVEKLVGLRPKSVYRSAITRGLQMA